MSVIDMRVLKRLDRLSMEVIEAGLDLRWNLRARDLTEAAADVTRARIAGKRLAVLIESIGGEA
jgi:hypothetical protein